MALDKQINLFKVDTDAFLSYREYQDKISLKELQKYQYMLLRKLKELKKSKDICDKYDYENIEKKLSKLQKEIKLYKKIYKSCILEDALKAVEYNNTHENKIIRKLNNDYLSYIDNNGIEKINLKNIVSMFESTLSRRLAMLLGTSLPKSLRTRRFSISHPSSLTPYSSSRRERRSFSTFFSIVSSYWIFIRKKLKHSSEQT